MSCAHDESTRSRAWFSRAWLCLKKLQLPSGEQPRSQQAPSCHRWLRSRRVFGWTRRWEQQLEHPGGLSGRLTGEWKHEASLHYSTASPSHCLSRSRGQSSSLVHSLFSEQENIQLSGDRDACARGPSLQRNTRRFLLTP